VPAWSLVMRGNTGTPSFDASIYGQEGMVGVDRICYWQPPLHIGVQALWFLLVPFSVHSMRMLSMIAGLAGMVCWAVALWRLTGNASVAALLYALMSCDYVAVTAAGFGRADAMAFAFQAAAYACYLSLRGRNLGRAILVGHTFVAASGLTHPNGGMLGFLGLMFLIWFLDRDRLAWKYALAGSAPYFVGAAAWGAYILVDRAAFLSQFGYQAGMRFGGLSHPAEAIRQEMGRYVQMMGVGGHSPGSIGPHFLKMLIFACYAAGLAGVLCTPSLRRTKPVRALLGVVGIYVLFYTFLEGTKATYYFIYLAYPLTAILSIWAVRLWEMRRALRTLILLGVAAWVAVGAGGLVLRARLDAYQNRFIPAVDYLRSHMRPGSLVDGSLDLGFALGFGPGLVDDHRMGLFSGRQPDYIVIEEIYESRLDALSRQRPGDYLAVLHLLSSRYHEVYNRGGYRILARNQQSGSPVAVPASHLAR
jgi:hypothetical protein